MEKVCWRYFISENKKILSAAFFLFIVGSLIFCWKLQKSEQHYYVDSKSYESIALRKINTDKFEHNNIPTVHPLGYPIVLYGVYRYIGKSVWIMVLLQLLLAWLSIVLIMHTAYVWYDKKTAQYSLFLSISNLGFYIFPQIILVETGQLFLIAFAWERFFVFLKNKKLVNISLSGLGLGLSLLLKPSILYLPIVLLLFLLLARKLILNYTSLLAAISFLFFFYLPMILMMIRNFWVFGYFRFSYLFEEGLFIFFHKEMLVRMHSYSEAQAYQVINNTIDYSINPFESSKWILVKNLFMKNFSKGWLEASYISFLNILRNLFGLYSKHVVDLVSVVTGQTVIPFFKISASFFEAIVTYITNQTTDMFLIIISIYECIYTGVRWILLFLAGYREYSDLGVQLCIVSTFYCCGLLCMTGTSRYRLIAEPLLIIVAARGLIAVLDSGTYFVNLKIRKIA